jgi:hypothetical protein
MRSRWSCETQDTTAAAASLSDKPAFSLSIGVQFFDPFERRVLTVALASSELAGSGDVASAGCVIVVAAFEAPTVIACLDDVAMVSQAVARCPSG